VVPDALLDEAARRFGLLSEPTRLRILRALHDGGECSVQQLAEGAHTSVSNVSQHLHRLLASGIVGRRRVGKTVRYRITDPTISELCDLVCHGLQARAQALTV
jgi:DNA-binding transcriptional ArsR family regulator